MNSAFLLFPALSCHFTLLSFKRDIRIRCLPRKWCRGIIVPIHELGDRSNTCYSRGICLVNFFVKITFLALINILNKIYESNIVF